MEIPLQKYNNNETKQEIANNNKKNIDERHRYLVLQ